MWEKESRSAGLAAANSAVMINARFFLNCLSTQFFFYSVGVEMLLFLGQSPGQSSTTLPTELVAHLGQVVVAVARSQQYLKSVCNNSVAPLVIADSLLI